ncbi:MAG TPA: hypothetical protein VHQ03_12280, partial [Candidatus Dormibacteraeota bacterium]|nr:hypothetical protein [Candidatus Dormibacteraeota bacterium]
LRQHRETNRQWLAAAVAVLLTIAVVAGLMSTRLAHRASVPASTPKASRVNLDRDYAPPPSGVALFYVESPSHPGWYIGFDWDGKPWGTIKLQPNENGYLTQAPGGSGFLTFQNAKGGSPQVLDRLGNPIGDLITTRLQSLMWSDDGRSYCTLDASNWRIGVQTVGGPPAATHVVALDSSNLRSGIIALGFRSCSQANDRAILVYNAFGRPSEVWVVRLSDGAILFHQTYDTNTLADITASADGSLIAESSNKSSGYLAGATAPSTTIRRVPDGAVLATLDPGYGVVAFSADHSSVLVTTSPWASGTPTHLALVELATGKVLWRHDGDQELAGFFTEPTGAAFAIMLQDPHDQSLHPPVSIVLAYANGRSFGLPGEFVRP